MYARKQVAIFDDVFAGLDTVTEQTVFANVFGSGGLLARTGTTTILASHGGEYCSDTISSNLTHLVHRLSEADHIIVLGKSGHIIEQGAYLDLSISGEYVQSLAKASEIDSTNGLPNPQSEVQNRPAAPSRTVPFDSSRRMGDFQVYVYYSKALGKLGLIAFASFVILNSVFETVQCRASFSVDNVP